MMFRATQHGIMTHICLRLELSCNKITNMTFSLIKLGFTDVVDLLHVRLLRLRQLPVF